MQPSATPHPCAALACPVTRVHRLAPDALERYRHTGFVFRHPHVLSGVRIAA